MNLVNTLKQKSVQIVRRVLHNPVCWSCGLQHQGAELTCDSCRKHIKTVLRPCQQCGLSHNNESLVCPACTLQPKPWQQMVAPLSYQSPVSDLIVQLKYSQKLAVLSALLELVEPYLMRQPTACLIPVPLHEKRYLERGFNQSFEITIGLAKRLNMPFSDQLIRRVVNTPRQSELNMKQRQTNLKNAFWVSQEMHYFEHVIIVDDVVTTGSTVKEITRQCLKQGVKRVDVWALARTEPYD